MKRITKNTGEFPRVFKAVKVDDSNTESDGIRGLKNGYYSYKPERKTLLKRSL